MACPERRSRRILDYLNDGEELGVEEPVVTPRSPAALEAVRSLLPRFRWARLARLGRKGSGGKGKEEIAVKCEHPSASTSVREADRDTRPSDPGVGLSLIFLLAKTSGEFNKMVKVRAEMETLLKEIKDQVRKNSEDHDASKTHNLESTTSSCVTDRNKSANVHLEDHITLSSMEVVSCEKSSEYECCMRTDLFAEEFHAELERRQVNYSSDIPSFLPEEEHDAEPLDEITDYRQEFDVGMGAVEYEYDNDAEYNGVSPVELERRLHELLHQRNQERIEELETALRCVEKKLVEKEMEVCLWKDTAKLALQQDDELQ